MVNNMAFENVDVSSLRNALTQCKNSINHSTTDELMNNISNASVWQTSAQTNLKNALTKFGNERYKNLEDKINSYFTIVSYIEKYQNLQKENVSLENQYSSLSNRLYYTETYTTTSTASDGTVSTETHTRRVKDRWVESQMSNVRKKINDNKEEMENLKNRVSNSI